MQNNVEIIQINISGEDKPGMTSSLTEIATTPSSSTSDRPTSTSR
jgi:hypothetical protein